MNAERTILRVLDEAKPRLLNVGTLWSDVHLEDDRVSYSVFRKSLQKLEEKEQVVVVPGEDRDKAKITQAGEARLAE
ncbi:hypothetical protein ACFPK9_01195 [Rubritalea spongiae]|uniref:MarR family transcriptional regulator n=1 Tax=Rubritalea spongiae TaxID=430797 RepID=A0ABW5DYQ5_9BACT